MDLPPNGLFSLLAHLLTNITAHYLEDSSKFSFSLKHQIALPDQVLLVTITNILDVKVGSTFFLQATSEMGEEVVAFKVKKASTAQFVFNHHIVILCLLLEDDTAFLTHFSSRSTHAYTFLNELDP